MSHFEKCLLIELWIQSTLIKDMRECISSNSPDRLLGFMFSLSVNGELSIDPLFSQELTYRET